MFEEQSDILRERVGKCLYAMHVLSYATWPLCRHRERVYFKNQSIDIGKCTVQSGASIILICRYESGSRMPKKKTFDKKDFQKSVSLKRPLIN